MNYDNLLKNEQLNKILDDYNKAIEKRSEYKLGFNIFSLVSDTYKKENFHSEIIAEILSPNANSRPASKHEEGQVFLEAFLDYINVDKKNYQNDVRVINEKGTDKEENGRMDILIQSNTHAVIIENKINDAGDQKNQLLRYYHDCIKKKKQVDAIIYLTKNGKKSPPYNNWLESDNTTQCDVKTIEEIRNIVRQMAAFDIKEPSLTLYKWLEKCINQSSKEDNKFILKQYSQLLKSIRGFILETDALKDYYEYIAKYGKPNNNERFGKLNEGLIKMYYPTLLKEKIEGNSDWNKHYCKCDLYEGNGNSALMISTQENTQKYFLEITFSSDTDCTICIKDISSKGKKWGLDNKLNSNEVFKSKFGNKQKKNGTDLWQYDVKYQLLVPDHFDALVTEIVEILKIFNPESKESKNSL